MRQDSNLETEPLLPEWLTRRRIYRGWWIVLVGFLLLAVAARAQVETGFTLQRELDMARIRAGQEAFPTYTDFYLLIGVTLIVAPVVGFLVDRFGPAAVTVPVMVGAAIVFAAAGFTDEIWLAYLAWLVTMGILAGAVLIGFAKAAIFLFSRNRGKALAVLLAGVTLAPLAPMPMFRFQRAIYWLFPYDYTRGVWPDVRGFSLLSLTDIAVLLAIGSIPLYFLLRRRLRDGGSIGAKRLLVVNDTEPSREEGAHMQPLPELSLPLRSILLRRSYLLLLAACALQASAILVLPLLPIVFVLQDLLGYSQVLFPLRVSESSSQFGSVSAEAILLGVIVLLVSGVLTDRFGSRRVALGTIVMQLICVAILAFEIEGWSVLVFTMAIGVGVGILCVPIVALVAEYSGTRHFGLMLGILASTSLGGYALAAELVSYIPMEIQFDLLPYITLAPLAIALVLILLMKRPQPAVPNPPVAETEPQVA